MVKGWNLVASKQFWFHTLGHQSMNDVFQFSPLKLIIRNILRSIISWRYWTQKICKTFLSAGFESMLNTDTLFFIFFLRAHHRIKHPSLKQKTLPETKGTSQPIWLRDALGKIHPNAGGFTSHWIFFLSFHKLSFPTVQIAAAWWHPPPRASFRFLSLPVLPAPLEGSAPSPQVSTTPVRLGVSFPIPQRSSAPEGSWEQTISFPLG